MPIYEYQCEACGHVLDALQKINDAPLKKCPDCGKPKLKRLLSAPMFLLKGTGWYETDFKSDQERKKNLADRPDSNGPDKEEKKEEKTEKAEKADTKADPAPADSAKNDAKPEPKAEPAKPKPTRAMRPARKGSVRKVKRTKR